MLGSAVSLFVELKCDFCIIKSFTFQNNYFNTLFNTLYQHCVLLMYMHLLLRLQDKNRNMALSYTILAHLCHSYIPPFNHHHHNYSLTDKQWLYLHKVWYTVYPRCPMHQQFKLMPHWCCHPGHIISYCNQRVCSASHTFWCNDISSHQLVHTKASGINQLQIQGCICQHRLSHLIALLPLPYLTLV